MRALNKKKNLMDPSVCTNTCGCMDGKVSRWKEQLSLLPLISLSPGLKITNVAAKLCADNTIIAARIAYYEFVGATAPGSRQESNPRVPLAIMAVATNILRQS